MINHTEPLCLFSWTTDAVSLSAASLQMDFLESFLERWIDEVKGDETRVCACDCFPLRSSSCKPSDGQISLPANEHSDWEPRYVWTQLQCFNPTWSEATPSSQWMNVHHLTFSSFLLDRRWSPQQVFRPDAKSNHTPTNMITAEMSTAAVVKRRLTRPPTAALNTQSGSVSPILCTTHTHTAWDRRKPIPCQNESGNTGTEWQDERDGAEDMETERERECSENPSHGGTFPLCSLWQLSNLIERSAYCCWLGSERQLSTNATSTGVSSTCTRARELFSFSNMP